MAELRPARPGDLVRVLALWQDAGSEPSVTDDETALVALLDRDPDALVVAVDGGEIVGTLIAGWDGWRMSLYRLAVAHAARRQGLATELVRWAEARAARLGARRVTAIVVGSAGAAPQFWAAVGYTQQTDRVRFVRNLEAGGDRGAGAGN